MPQVEVRGVLCNCWAVLECGERRQPQGAVEIMLTPG